MVQEKANSTLGPSESSPYEIQIQGKLDDRWADWFDGIQITIEHPNDQLPFTRLNCPAIDQAKLRGILNKIWDMNLNLISVHRITEKAQRDEPPPDLQDSAKKRSCNVGA